MIRRIRTAVLSLMNPRKARFWLILRVGLPTLYVLSCGLCIRYASPTPQVSAYTNDPKHVSPYH